MPDASNKLNLNPEQLSVLLKIISSKTGKDPVVLKSELENGSYDNIIHSLGADKGRLTQLLNNKEELERLLSSPQVQFFLRQVFGAKN